MFLLKSVCIRGLLRKTCYTAMLLALLFVALHGAVRGAYAQNFQFPSVINTVAGNGTAGYTGDNGPATSAELNSPYLAVADANGNIYIDDSVANVIRRVDAVTGVITTVAGGGAPCAAGDAIGNGCPATQATLSTPMAVRIYNGDLYIADFGNSYIRKVSAATGIISIYAGNGGTAAPTAGASATGSAIAKPQELIFDNAGNAYVATSGASAVYILKIGANGGTVSIIAGNGTAGITGTGGVANLAEIRNVQGMAFDTLGNLYLAEVNASGTDVRQILAANGVVSGSSIIGPYVESTPAANGNGGDGACASAAKVNTPEHLAVDSQNNLYIADSGNNRLRVVGPLASGTCTTGPNIATPNYTPSGGFGGDGLPLNGATFKNPKGVAVTPAGDLLIAESGSYRVRAVTPEGVFGAVAIGSPAIQTVYFQSLVSSATPSSIAVTSGTTDFSVSNTLSGTGCAWGTALTTVKTNCSVQVTFTPAKVGKRTGQLVLQDSAGNSYVLALSGTGSGPAAALLPGAVSTMAGNGNAGSTGNGGAATAALLNRPTRAATDNQGNIFLADSANNQVREISASTGAISLIVGASNGSAGYSGDNGPASSAMLNNPIGVALDAAGNLYIADSGNNRVRVVSATTGAISTFAGNGTQGYQGDGGTAAAAELNAPTGLAVSANGMVYIADKGNNAIRVVSLRSGLISTFAGTGTAGLAGDGGPAQQAELNAPQDVAVFNNNLIYVADTGNNNIRAISDGLITTAAGLGSAGFNGDGPAAGAQLNAPASIAVDAAGNVYVADTGNDYVRRISAGQIVTFAGTGVTGYAGDSGSSDKATFSAPAGVALAGNGNILIADTGNNALRGINVASESIAFPNTSPATSSSAVSTQLVNSGNTPLSVASVAVTGSFVEQNGSGTNCNGTGVSLAPAASCQLSFVFSPPALANYTGSAVITDNAQGQAGATQNIALAGTGVYVFTASFSLPPTVIAGTAQSIKVNVTNPASIYRGTIHFTSTDPKAVLPANYTFTAADAGEHTFSITLETAGLQTVTIADTVDSSLAATNSANVTGGAPSSISITSGSGQSAGINTKFAQPLSVSVKDAYGNPASSIQVTFTAPSSGATATLAGAAMATVTTNSLGQATSPVLTADLVSGTYQVTASVVGVSTPAQFTLTNTSSVASDFNITATPSNVAMTLGQSATATITITGVGGFDGAVKLACTGAPDNASCQLGSTTLGPSPTGGSLSTQLTFQTSATQTSQLIRDSGVMCASLFGFVFGFGLFGLRRKKLNWLAMILLLVATATGAVGCGGSMTKTISPGSYTLTITGTSGTQVHSTSVTFYASGVTR